MLDVDHSQGTKDTYQRELRVVVIPFFENFTIREITVGRIELFLRQQREIAGRPLDQGLCHRRRHNPKTDVPARAGPASCGIVLCAAAGTCPVPTAAWRARSTS